MKLQEKRLALKMRREGKSYTEINKRITVSKSTLSLWLRDVELAVSTRNRVLNGLERGRENSARTNRAKRLQATTEARLEALREFPSLLKKPLFLAGLALYWAEGDKNKQERVKFTNSDHRLIVIMMKWFRSICRAPEKKFRIALHLHDLQINKEVLRFWSKVTGVPNSQFHTPYVKRSSLGYRKNPLYNGTCSVMVHSKYLFRKIMSWEELLFKIVEEMPMPS
ncbi:MAG TPA: hypothetical protein VJJ22_01410 [Candidatus Paceibacterota bacterium]